MDDLRSRRRKAQIDRLLDVTTRIFIILVLAAALAAGCVILWKLVS